MVVLQVLPGLKGDGLQKMLFWLGGDWESFLPDEGEKELRETSADILGYLMNGKSRAQT